MNRRDWSALALSFVLCSCATPEQECAYGSSVERTLTLLPREHPIGATGTSLVLKGDNDGVRFVSAKGVSNGPFTIRGTHAFVPAGLVVQDGQSARLVNSTGDTIRDYPPNLNCTPLTLGRELTVCSNAFALSKLNGDKLESLLSAEGRFEPQFDGLNLCVATYLVDRTRLTFPPTLKRSMTYCGAVTETGVSFSGQWDAQIEVLLSGGRTFLATSTDAGISVSDATDSTQAALLPTGTRLSANSCRIWAENPTGIYWLDPRSLNVTRVGDALDSGTRVWSTNLSGAQLEDSNELRLTEIEQ